jgi:hypothetical protein
MVVTIERAEKLKETLSDLIAPLTRLGELVCIALEMPCL